MEYTPEQVKQEKRKNLVSTALLILPILFGLLILIGSFADTSEEPLYNVSEMSYKSMMLGAEYYFDEMILVDKFASYGNETTGYSDAEYYIVCFVDKEKELVYATLKVDKSDEIKDTCSAYIDDKTLNVGDVTLSGCFSSYTNGSVVQEYFEEAYEIFNEQMVGESLDWYFVYEAKNAEALAEKESTNQWVMLGAAAVFMVPAALGMWALSRKRKELNEYLEEYNEGYFEGPDEPIDE